MCRVDLAEGNTPLACVARTITLGDAGPHARITVTNQGLGIPAADLPFIFDRFARAGNVVGHIQGTGIGLASARGIIKQHGGTITVESREGHGATFTIRLPIAAAPANAQSGRIASQPFVLSAHPPDSALPWREAE